MPKMKTKRAAAKRFRQLGSGKFKRGKAGKRHLLYHETRKRKRGLSGTAVVDATNHDSVARMLPYGT